MIEITDRDILLQLTNTEDSFVERKTINDLGDCLKTVVAFANTVPIGHSAVLFVGVRDNGEPDGTISDLDKLQQKLSGKIAEAYPTIYVSMRVLAKDGKQFITVIIPGSSARPHFAGPAYVRDASKSVIASDAQFGRLISERSAKTYEILKWKDRDVTLTEPGSSYKDAGHMTLWTNPNAIAVTVADCNLHYVTFTNSQHRGWRVSRPLRTIELSYDHKKDRLELRLLEGPLPLWS